jgi:transcriptional regulator of acetoin/glycerol metabolism
VRKREPDMQSQQPADVTCTVSGIEDEDRDLVRGAEWPRLVVALECRRPLAGSARISLADVDRVVVGRGSDRSWRRAGERTLVVSVPDTEMSRQHFELARAGGGWEVVDLGSKNGTQLGRTPVLRATLSEGDVIEAGATLFLFQEDGFRGHEPPPDRDNATDGAPSALRTVSPMLERHFAALAQIARSTVAVLVRGETGTGKELAARAIHDLSGRRGSFVAVNCGALPRTLIESELFGYKRGAFSGAREDSSGLVRRADGGTLFLDEIAELPEESQVALLRVLQEGEVRPIGSAEPVHVDVRVVAATHQDIEARIAVGTFRRDLYARLAGFIAELPPLRDRREDLGTVLANLLPRIADGGAIPRLQRTAGRHLFAYPFPLNIRELEQALRAAVVLAGRGDLKAEHLPQSIREYQPPAAAPLRAEDRVLRDRLVELLREHRGNVTAAGRALGKAPIQIRRWCRRFSIDIDAFRA